MATLQNGDQHAVGATTPVKIAESRSARTALLVQHIAGDPVRIGGSTVTATTGVKLSAGDTLIFDDPVITASLWAIRDGGVTDATILVAEVT